MLRFTQSDAPGPGMAAFPDPFTYQLPAPGRSTTKILQQLAICYLRDPDSQVSVTRMEPGADGYFKAVVTVEIDVQP
jgi:hypothetical protein